jgi:hypothetical protein
MGSSRATHEWDERRRALECGEFSPLCAGDLSPSEAGTATKPHPRPTAGASRKRAHSSGHSRPLDGDKSPRESADQSPHSKTRLRAAWNGRSAAARNGSSRGIIPNCKNTWCHSGRPGWKMGRCPATVRHRPPGKLRRLRRQETFVARRHCVTSPPRLFSGLPRGIWRRP